MQTIKEICETHRAKEYFDDGKGRVGVYNHNYHVMWYVWTKHGYSNWGSTATAQGAKLHKLS